VLFSRVTLEVGVLSLFPLYGLDSPLRIDVSFPVLFTPPPEWGGTTSFFFLPGVAGDRFSKRKGGFKEKRAEGRSFFSPRVESPPSCSPPPTMWEGTPFFVSLRAQIEVALGGRSDPFSAHLMCPPFPAKFSRSFFNRGRPAFLRKCSSYLFEDPLWRLTLRSRALPLPSSDSSTSFPFPRSILIR